MSVATFIKYLLKALAISCGSVKFQLFLKILDGSTLGNFLKMLDCLYLFMNSLSHLGCFGNSLGNKIFYFLSLELAMDFCTIYI